MVIGVTGGVGCGQISSPENTKRKIRMLYY